MDTNHSNDSVQSARNVIYDSKVSSAWLQPLVYRADHDV